MSNIYGAAFDGPSAGKSLASGETLRLGSSAASVDSNGNLTVNGATGPSQSASQTIAGTHGEQMITGSTTEVITLSTSGLTTDSTTNLLPANSVIRGVVARVTTTITVTTDWELGDATIAARFSTANSTLTAGTTQVGTAMADQTGTSGPIQTAAAKLRITCSGSNPGAGKIRVTVFYQQFVPPTS